MESLALPLLPCDLVPPLSLVSHPPTPKFAYFI